MEKRVRQRYCCVLVQQIIRAKRRDKKIETVPSGEDHEDAKSPK